MRGVWGRLDCVNRVSLCESEASRNWPPLGIDRMLGDAGETGDLVAARSPSGWSRVISVSIMRHSRSGVQFAPARCGWSFDRGTARHVARRSRSAAGAIEANGIVVPSARRMVAARACVALAESTGRRTRDGTIIAIASVIAAVESPTVAWRINVLRI